MKKILMTLLVSAFMFGGMVAYAQNTEVDLPDPGLTPDSPLYFLDQLFDQIRTAFTLNPEARIKVHLSIANERLAELRISIKNKKEKAAEKARELYEKRAQKAQDEAEKSGKEDLVKSVKESYLKHIEVLKRVREEAPEQAWKGIDRALENAERLREKKIELREKLEEKLDQKQDERQARRDERQENRQEAVREGVEKIRDIVACTAQYDPVCGVDGKTYANTCVAELQQKVGVAYKGECRKNTVIYTGLDFALDVLNIKKGETVTWLNKSLKPMRVASAIHPTHAVYPVSGGCVGSVFDACKEINSGESWSFIFDQVGIWKYHNHYNPRQTGTIVVSE